MTYIPSSRSARAMGNLARDFSEFMDHIADFNEYLGKLVSCEPWVLPAKFSDKTDTRKTLEEHGFAILGTRDSGYIVDAPTGWVRDTAYYSTFYIKNGTKAIWVMHVSSDEPMYLTNFVQK